MACKIAVSLLSESQKGTIGNDWRYDLEVKVFRTSGSRALMGQGTISVPKHRLDSGKTQVPPAAVDALVLPAGEAGDAIFVDLRLCAAEVDLMQDDAGEATASFKMTCPPVGDTAVVEEREISVSVLEQPSGVGRALFRLDYRVTLESA